MDKNEKMCYVCGRRSVSLCDASKENGEPCDMPMCEEHRNKIGVDLDVCEYHSNKKDILQAGENRVKREDAKEYFIQEYLKQDIRVVPGHWPDFATKEEVDDWLEKQNKHYKLFDELFNESEE